MRVGSWVIAEPSAAGHRLWYVRLLVEAALRDCSDSSVVVLTSRDAVSSLAWKVHLADHDGRFEVRHEQDAVTDWRTWALEELRADPPDRLVLPDADKWLVGLIGGPPPAELVSALLMRPALPPGLKPRIRGLVKRMYVRRALRIRWLRLYALAMFTEGNGPSRVPLLPDPIELPEADASRAENLRREWGIAGDDVVVLALGDLSRRKAVDVLAEAWPLMRSPGRRLALVGDVAPECRDAVAALAATDPSVIVRDGYVDEDEFHAWLSAANVVAALHRNVGSSGVALKCWAWGVPVAVPRGSGFEAELRRAGVHTVGCPLEPRGLAVALDGFVEDAASVQAQVHVPPVSVVGDRLKSFTGALLGGGAP